MSQKHAACARVTAMALLFFASAVAGDVVAQAQEKDAAEKPVGVSAEFSSAPDTAVAGRYVDIYVVLKFESEVDATTVESFKASITGYDFAPFSVSPREGRASEFTVNFWFIVPDSIDGSAYFSIRDAEGSEVAYQLVTVSGAFESFLRANAGWLGVLLVVLVGVAFALVVRARSRSMERIAALQEQVEVAKIQLGYVASGGQPSSATSTPSPAAVKPLEIPDAILDAIVAGELTIVLGGGASAQAGLPVGNALWLPVLERLKDRVPHERVEQLRQLLNEGSPEEFVDPLVSLVGRGPVLEAVQQELALPEAALGSFHQHLRDLQTLGVECFVDVTWDGALAATLKPAEPRVFTPRRHEGVTEALRGTQVSILKPIGVIDDFESVALTAREARRALSHAPELERCLASLFSTQTLLFLGMSTRAIEQFVSSLPAGLDSTGRQHFALVAFDWKDALWAEGFGKRIGLTLLPFAAERDQAISAITGRLVEQARREQARKGKSAQAPGIGRLRTIQLRNIGNFTSLEIELNDGWNVLLGDNGGGKSTMLRAVALAMAGNDPRGQAMGARLLRTGEREGSIELTFGTSGAIKVRTALIRDGSRVRVDAQHITPLQAGKELVLAFPALRGATTASPKGPTKVAVAGPSVDDIQQLLQEQVDTRLDQLKQWVINTALQAEREPKGREARMFATFCAVLRDLVPGRHVDFDRVDRATWVVWLRTDDGPVAFDALSQGTSAILGWVGVLLQRLYETYPDEESPEDCAALVLIDEIDAHLHPRWQRKLVTSTRERFKNVQMLASSHSPLLAGALTSAELRIVERDPDTGRMRADRPREELCGQSADDILTSSLFELKTTRSPEAEATIKNYFALFEKPHRTEHEEKKLQGLEQDLIQLNYGPKMADRKRQAALDEVMKAQLAAITPEVAAAISARLASSDSTPTTADLEQRL